MAEKKISAAPAQHGPSDPNVAEGWTGPARPNTRKSATPLPAAVTEQSGLASKIYSLASRAYKAFTAG